MKNLKIGQKVWINLGTEPTRILICRVTKTEMIIHIPLKGLRLIETKLYIGTKYLGNPKYEIANLDPTYCFNTKKGLLKNMSSKTQ